MIERDKKNLTPYLLEINQCPSLRTDSPIDVAIKRGLVEDTIRTLCVNIQRKAAYKKEARDYMNARLTKQIRPSIVDTQTTTNMSAAEKMQYEAQRV